MIERKYYLEKIDKAFKYTPIVALMGARQVGKTSLMRIYAGGKNVYWIDGQNPEESQVFSLFSTLEKFLKLKMNEDLSGLLIIDEFQYIHQISLMLKLLVDKYPKIRILCSGSSSIDILQKTDESLAGRLRIIPVYSLAFNEFVLFRNKNLYRDYQKLKNTDQITLLLPQIGNYLEEYLLYGGMPKTALTDDPDEQREQIKDIVQTYLLKDIRQFVKNEDFTGFNKLLRILAAQIGNMLNINELSNTVRLSYRKCEEYIYLLEQMYIIRLLPPFTTNKRNEIVKMKKIYFIDLGLRNFLSGSFTDLMFRNDAGALFENFIYLELSRFFPAGQVFYYRTKDRSEIDFIVNTGKHILPVEVKFKDIKKRSNIKALSLFMDNNSSEAAFVVSPSFQDETGKQKYVLPYHFGERIVEEW